MAGFTPSEGDRLGERLRARRKALGKTLAEVADGSGLSLPYVSNLERGHGNPTIEALRALASALGLPLAEIVGRGEADEDFDPLDLVLADAPPSLWKFAKSKQFTDTVDLFWEGRSSDPEEMARRLLIGMASAPKRSSGEATEEDWRRLLDAYTLILRED
ncbi:MAG: helix-turn-helix transcriptional regulator [bacterium]|nr:helix-turn-helix transcriptional regulator [bacterium]